MSGERNINAVLVPARIQVPRNIPEHMKMIQGMSNKRVKCTCRGVRVPERGVYSTLG